MELKELDCPFCDVITDWKVLGVEFVKDEIYMEVECGNCKKKAIVAVPVVFSHMRMFVTPKKASETYIVPTLKAETKSVPNETPTLEAEKIDNEKT